MSLVRFNFGHNFGLKAYKGLFSSIHVEKASSNNSDSHSHKDPLESRETAETEEDMSGVYSSYFDEYF
jgi:hypothetical protein